MANQKQESKYNKVLNLIRPKQERGFRSKVKPQTSYESLEPRMLLATANLLVNGDFETGSNFQGIQADVDVVGWNAFPDGGERVLDVVPGNGNNVLRLDSKAGRFDRIYQDVATTAGQTYLLRFDAYGQGNGETRSDEVRVFWDGDFVGAFRGITVQQSFAIEVTGSGDTSRLELREAWDVLGGDGQGPIIDNISFTPVTAHPFSNGSFEEGERSSTTAHTFITDIAPWHTNGPAVERYASIRQYSNENSNGDYYWNLDTSYRYDRLFHGIETSNENNYVLMLDMRSPVTSLESSNQLRVRWNGEFAATLIPTHQWQTFAVELTGAREGTSWLDLREAYSEDLGDGIGPWIDNIRIFEKLAPSDEAVQVQEISPANGEESVNVTQESVVRFDGPVDPATVTEDSFYVIANSQRIPGRVVVSANERFATYFYDAPLPSSTEVRVVVDGRIIEGRNGLPIDANRNGFLGGVGFSDFSTLPLTRIPDTNVFGFVRDSETGEPLVGATIRVDAFPEANVVTDANGRFELTDMPAPDFFVHIDGSTVTDAPAGFVYPNVGKPFHSVPGQTVQISANAEVFDIFLPPMALADIQDLSTTEDSQVGFGAAGLARLEQMFPTIAPATWERVQLTIAPGNALDEQGNAATQAAIIPVDPDRLPGPLPPFVDPQLVISIQSPGATNFDVPAPVTFPNLDNLAPGSKASLHSFNHDSGKWITIGLGTVSADGTVIESDPGVGILAPGWHYTSPPSNWTGGGGQPQQSNNNTPTPDIETRLFASGDTDTLSFSFTAPAGSRPGVGQHNPPAGQTEPTRVVRITVRDQSDFTNFYDGSGSNGLKTETITLRPGDANVTRSATLRSLQEVLNRINGGSALDHDAILGAVVEVDETLTRADGSQQRDRRIIVPYFLVDQSDDVGTDQILKLADTVITNDASFKRQIDLQIGSAPIPTFVFGANSGDYSDAIDGIRFNPSATGNRNSSLGVEISLEGQTIRSTGGPAIQANGTEIQRVNVNKADLIAALADTHVQARIKVSYAAANNADTYTLTFAGNTTAAIRFDGSAASIGTALAATAGLAAADVEVRSVKTSVAAGVTTTYFEVDFKNAVAGTANVLSGTNSSAAATLNVQMSVTQAEYQLLDTAAERTAIADGVATQMTALFNGNQDGVVVVDSAGTSTVTIDWGDAPRLGGLGTSRPVGIDDAAMIKAALAAYRGNTQVVRNFHLDQAINRNLTTTVSAYVDTALEFRDLTTLGNAAAQTTGLINTFAKTAVHEAGHSYGARHTWTSSTTLSVNGVAGITDIMKQGIDFAGTLQFREFLSANVLDLGLNLGWTESEGKRAWDLYVAHYAAKATGFDEVVEDPDDPNFVPGAEDETDPEPFDGRLLLAFDEFGSMANRSIDFGQVVADGDGSELATFSLTLVGAGVDDLTIDSVSLGENSDAFNITGVSDNTTLGFGENATLDISFDPTAISEHSTTLTILSNDSQMAEYVFDLSGFALQTTPKIGLSVIGGNNNFGGVTIGQSDQLEIVVTNEGNMDLEVTPMFTSGVGNFGITDADVMQTLGAGESQSYFVSFSPAEAKLVSGMIEFATNDPDQPTLTQGFVGTGLPVGGITLDDFDWGNDFAVIEYSGFLQRAVTNSVGDFQFELPVDTEYTFRVFDPVSGLIATSTGLTGPAGAFTNLTSSLAFTASTEADLDFDRLPADIELAIGTDVANADTDGDGVSDGNEIEQGLNPLDGFAASTGSIASLDLPGESEAVVIDGDLGFVATGSHGLVIIDTSDFNSPIMLGQLELNGPATSIGSDPRLDRVAIATGLSLSIVDVSDPMMPQLTLTVPHAATHLAVGNGVAYAVGGNILRVVDLISGEVLQTLSLGNSGSVTGVALDGNLLAAYLGGSDALVLIDVTNEGSATIASTISVSIASSDVGISLGNDVAWLAGSGLSSIDVSDPLNPAIISTADTFFTSRRVALNGSGLGLIAPDGGAAIEVYDVSDTAITDQRLQSFALSSNSNDVAISRGIGWIATSNGLEVVNYLAFDSLGVAPILSISTTVVDADPSVEGIQVLEGSTIPIQVSITDDVQVNEVTVVVNGQAVLTDTSFPFNFNLEAPIVDGSDVLEIRVSATDTGGNQGISETLVMQLTPDVFAPTIEALLPADGSQRFVGHRTARIRFNEPLAPASIEDNNIKLISAGANGVLGDADDVTVASEIQLRDDDRQIQLTANEGLAAGIYQLVISETGVTDRRGNALGDGLTTSTFEVKELDESTEFLPFGSDITIRQDDTSFQVADMPFNFEFFGESVGSEMWVTTNGAILFEQDSLGGAYSNFELPASHVGAFPFFDDLDPRQGENPRIGLFDGEGVRAISFFDVPQFSNNDIEVSFQIAFLSNGVIQIRYGDMGEELGDGAATIGLTNGTSASVPSLGNIENRPDVGITAENGFLTDDEFALLDEIFEANDILVFTPDGEGGYSISQNP